MAEMRIVPVPAVQAERTINFLGLRADARAPSCDPRSARHIVRTMWVSRVSLCIQFLHRTTLTRSTGTVLHGPSESTTLTRREVRDSPKNMFP